MPWGLLVDWGGVLTAPVGEAMAAWAARDAVRPQHLADVLQEWTEAPLPACGALLDAVAASPVHALERGEIDPAEFERALAEQLAQRGSPVAAGGLLARMLADLVHLNPAVVGLVQRARNGGVRTALLSNSWGEHYPEALFENLFDAVVISGRVGMRKPEPRIFHHTAAALGLPPERCVLLDDLRPNVAAAAAVGMVGVHFVDARQACEELEAILGLSLCTDPGRPGGTEEG